MSTPATVYHKISVNGTVYLYRYTEHRKDVPLTAWTAIRKAEIGEYGDLIATVEGHMREDEIRAEIASIVDVGTSNTR